MVKGEVKWNADDGGTVRAFDRSCRIGGLNVLSVLIGLGRVALRFLLFVELIGYVVFNERMRVRQLVVDDSRVDHEPSHCMA